MARTHKRELGNEQSSSIAVQSTIGDDSASSLHCAIWKPKRQKKADATDHETPVMRGALLLGSVRIDIMATHRCEESPTKFCYARCDTIKALLTKSARIRAVRAHGSDSAGAIAIHINGKPAATFDHESEAAFMAAMDAGQVIFARGVARSWAEIDFDVLAGPLNESATVPPEVQTCTGFEKGVLALDRGCDDIDCSCC